jgi:hypothetical protein
LISPLFKGRLRLDLISPLFKGRLRLDFISPLSKGGLRGDRKSRWYIKNGLMLVNNDFGLKLTPMGKTLCPYPKIGYQ